MRKNSNKVLCRKLEEEKKNQMQRNKLFYFILNI